MKDCKNWRITAKHPDHDAVVIIESRSGLVLIDFPAQGNSQRRAGGKIVGYTRRNPDRRALVLHMLATIEADFPGASPVAARGGKGGGWGNDGLMYLSGGMQPMHKLYSAGRNYRFSLWLRGFFGDSDSALAAFGLVPATHKSTAVEWPTSVDLGARITKHTGRTDLGFASYTACPTCDAQHIKSTDCPVCEVQP